RFPDNDIEERTSRWVTKCVKKFNPYARYGVEHWKNQHAKIYYIKRQQEPGKPKVDDYAETGLLWSLSVFIRSTRVLEGLKSYKNDVKYGYATLNLCKEDVEYLRLFKEEIEKRLKHRDWMRRWEISGLFDPYNYNELMGSLKGNEGYGRADYFPMGKDFRAYSECQDEMLILNTVGSHKLSSDRTKYVGEPMSHPESIASSAVYLGRDSRCVDCQELTYHACALCCETTPQNKLTSWTAAFEDVKDAASPNSVNLYGYQTHIENLHHKRK
ncbi:retrovirus-related pol polyprotein from transposon TNT 1-94, partial [Tanacetum coccineum]